MKKLKKLAQLFLNYQALLRLSGILMNLKKLPASRLYFLLFPTGCTKVEQSCYFNLDFHKSGDKLCRLCCLPYQDGYSCLKSMMKTKDKNKGNLVTLHNEHPVLTMVTRCKIALILRLEPYFTCCL